MNINKEWVKSGFDRWHHYVPCPCCLQPIHFYNATQSQYGTDPMPHFSRCMNERCENFSVSLTPTGYYQEFPRILKRVQDFGYTYPKKVIVFAKIMIE